MQQTAVTRKPLLSLFIVLCIVSLYAVTKAEQLPVLGDPVPSNMLDDVRGGFLSDGNFIYFSLDFMQFRFFSHNEPDSANSDGYMNSMSQSALITEEGIQVNLDILQSGSLSEIASDEAASEIPAQLLTGPQISFMNNQGFVNANVIQGDHNAAAITNVINLNIGFFEVQSLDNIQSVLQNWLPTY